MPTRTPTPPRSPVPSPTNLPPPTFTPHPRPGPILTFGGEGAAPYSSSSIAAFSPDGRRVALAGPDIRIWDTATFALLQEFDIPHFERCVVGRAVFSPDGTLLAVSTECPNEEDAPGHLLIWDTYAGELLKDWLQLRAHLTYKNQPPYSIPSSAFTFLPNSSRIAYASGNTVEIRDLLLDTGPVVFAMGDQMYATEISIRSDGQLLYVLMSWDRTHDFPCCYRTAFALQIWGLLARDLRKEIPLGEAGFSTDGMHLLGANLLHYSVSGGSAQITDLTNDKTRAFFYRQGKTFYNNDHSLAAVLRYFRIDPQDQGIEVWNTDTWRNLYTFQPAFGFELDLVPVDIVFSPDNSILAIVHQGRLTLWDIGPFVAP